MPGMCGTLWRIQEASGLSAMEVGEARGKAVALRPSHGGGKEFASQGQKREGHWGWCNNMSKDRQESKGELAQSVKSVSETVGQWTSGTYWDPAVESLKGQAMGFWLSSAGRGEPWLVFELRNDSGCLIWQHRIKQMGGSRERHISWKTCLEALAACCRGQSSYKLRKGDSPPRCCVCVQLGSLAGE